MTSLMTLWKSYVVKRNREMGRRMRARDGLFIVVFFLNGR